MNRVDIMNINCYKFLIFFVCLNIATLHADNLKQPLPDKKNIEKISQTFVNAVNNRNLEELKKVMDYDYLGKYVYKTIYPKNNKLQRLGFMQGFKENAHKNTFNAWFGVLNQTGGLMTYQKNLKIDNEIRALIRVNMHENGVNFLELIFDLKSKKIIDWYNYVSSKKLSEDLAMNAALSVSDNNNLIGKLFGVKKVNKKITNTFSKMTKHMAKGELKECYYLVESLPKEIQSARGIMLLKISSSSFISENVYRQELDKFAKLYGDETGSAFILLDHYFFKKEYNNVLKSINLIMKRTGDDSLLISMKAGLHMLNNQQKEAIKQIDKAIHMEPSQQAFYWTKMEILNQYKKFNEMVALFNFIEEKFFLEIDPKVLKEEPTYSDFVNSSAYKDWLQSKNKK